MKKTYFIIIALSVTHFIYGQSVKNIQNTLVEYKIHRSYIAAHHDFIKYYQTSHFNIHELSIGRVNNGKKLWHELYNYPVNGLGFQFVDFNNSDLGKLFALYYYIDIPLVKREKITMSFNFSSGLAYHNELFNEDNNHLNILISTKLNGLFNAEFNINYLVNNKLSLSTGLDFAHTSNGLVKSPNFGINMASINAGIRYYFEPEQTEIESHLKDRFQQHTDLILSLSTGYKNIFLEGQYHTFTFSADYGKHIGYRLRPGIGLEIYYDGYCEQKIIRELLENTMVNKLRYGIFVSNYLKFGSVAIFTQPEFILFSATKMQYRWFQNIGFIYYVTPRLFTRVLLRSYRFTADFIEWGLAYKVGTYVKGSDFKY